MKASRSRFTVTNRPAIPTRKQSLAERDAEIERLRKACASEHDELDQILGKALGYPLIYTDSTGAVVGPDAPGAVATTIVCTGDHVAVTLAMEVAEKIDQLRQRAERAEAEREKIYGVLRESGIAESYVGVQALAYSYKLSEQQVADLRKLLVEARNAVDYVVEEENAPRYKALLVRIDAALRNP